MIVQDNLKRLHYSPILTWLEYYVYTYLLLLSSLSVPSITSLILSTNTALTGQLLIKKKITHHQIKGPNCTANVYIRYNTILGKDKITDHVDITTHVLINPSKTLAMLFIWIRLFTFLTRNTSKLLPTRKIHISKPFFASSSSRFPSPRYTYA